MKTPLTPVYPSRPAFALISVLALVSLAALTATAFLASARLERSATRPIGDITRLQMTLNTGKECATEVINRIGEPYWNFVTTYWRTNSADELGYLFVGKPSAPANLVWYYYCGFTPAQWTNLDSVDMNTRIRATNTICQATYSNNMRTFMASATSGFSATPGITDPKCVQIPLLGGRTSPTVGWVYIKQDIRTNPSSTTTSNLPVARFAYFIEDLGGLIDADRMCGTNTRNTGTNAEEISLANLAGSAATNIAPTTLTNKRPQYLTPGMLLTTNGGVLTDTNDLRYFASRLRYCNWSNQNNNWDRIPMVPISSTLTNGSYYPSQAGQRKTNLSDATLLTPGGASKIAATINKNYPMFTNRAGGMDGVTYVNALAANIVDYADIDSVPTTVGNSVGFDSCPYPTIIFNKYTYTDTTKSISVQTFIQLWNLSTATSSATPLTLTCNLNDVYSNNTTPMFTAPIVTTFNMPKLLPNQGMITSTPITTISLAGDITNTPVPKRISINASSSSYVTTNTKFSLTIGGQLYVKMNTGFERKTKTVTNSPPDWSGGLPGLSYQTNAYGSYNVPSLGDPRMLFYLTNMPGKSGLLEARDYDQNVAWRLGYAQSVKTDPANTFKGVAFCGAPQFWPDSSNSTTSVSSGTTYADTSDPATGVFTPPGLAPCKISNTGSYSNITELGNIFDPMQWMKNINLRSQWVNYDVDGNAAPQSMYGGGQTLRIGRPEHSRFAFTNLGGNYPVPSLGTSAAGLLDLFCATNVYNWAGKININTAPPPVLAALAGGITLSRDANKVGFTTNTNMINRFTNGVMRFRDMYPFITPSQLSFISENHGETNWTYGNLWTDYAVFGTNSSGGGLAGVTSLNDEGREEWFSKIYHLTCVQSYNYRIYVVAQLTDTNGNPKGAMMRKYYQIYLNYNGPQPDGGIPDTQAPSVSPLPTYEAFY